MTWVYVGVGLALVYLLLLGLCVAAGRSDRVMERWRR